MIGTANKILVLAGTNYKKWANRLISIIEDEYGPQLVVWDEEEVDESALEIPDVLFSFSWPRRIKGKLLESRCVNGHFGALPWFRGRHPIIHAIDTNQATAACTFHLMDEKIDTGNILAEQHMKIEIYDTIVSLTRKVEAASEMLFMRELFNFVDPSVKGRSQVEYSHQYKRADLNREVVLNMSPLDVWNRVRAFDHPDYERAYVMLGGEKKYLTTTNTEYYPILNRTTSSGCGRLLVWI